MHLWCCWKILRIPLLFLFTFKHLNTVSAECLAVFLPHLIPTSAPEEIKTFVFGEKTSEISKILGLLCRNFIQKPNTDSSGKKKYYSVLDYYLKVYLKTKFKKVSNHSTKSVIPFWSCILFICFSISIFTISTIFSRYPRKFCQNI